MTYRKIISAYLLLLLSVNISHAQTGRLEITTTSSEILGPELAASFSKILEADEALKWNIYIPEDYDPSKPPGIVIHMPRNNMLEMPIGWASMMDERNLIWISLNNTKHLLQIKEMLISVLATPFLQNQYKIDADRVYIIASADRCYPASAAMQIYPHIFKGIVYSTCEPINWQDNIPENLDQMNENRYIFIASRELLIRQAARRSARQYRDAGITDIEYLLVTSIGYGRNLRRQKLGKVIDMLDIRD